MAECLVHSQKEDDLENDLVRYVRLIVLWVVLRFAPRAFAISSAVQSGCATRGLEILSCDCSFKNHVELFEMI